MDLFIAVLAGFIAAPLAVGLHRALGDRVVLLVALVPLGVAAYFFTYLAALPVGESLEVERGWVAALDLTFTLRLDGLSLFFVLLISGMGLLVVIYANGYLAGHPQLGMFYAAILSFMGAMLGVVLAGNLLTLFVFWELTTLTSFLLIGFEHHREAARKAALQSLLVTTVGGLSMLAGLVLLGLAGGSFELSVLLGRGEAVREHALYVPILILLALGAFTKSAQFPFHFWLPNAMQAPTPVSAYLHSATMVKAGIYLFARLSPVLGGTDQWMWLVTGVGAATMVLGAVMAFFQTDLKGILAYLTVNVLGTLMMLLGIGTDLAIKAAMTYLLAHALYKGALFLVAGIVDHGAHTRDIRQLGGLWRKMPVTAAAAVLAGLSMAGVISQFGFLAKELYLEAVWEAPRLSFALLAASILSSVLVVVGAGMVVVRPFFGPLTQPASKAHESGVRLWIGPLLLAAFGLAAGLLPAELAELTVTHAVAPIRPGAPVELKVWHGITPPLILSVTALVIGIAGYALRERLLARAPAVPPALAAWGPEATYGRFMSGLTGLAAWQSRALQSGYLRRYVTSILLVTIGLLLVGLLRTQPTFVAQERVGFRLHELLVALLILISAALTVSSRSRFRAVVALGVVGFGVAWLFNVFGAPDLAMTQIMVEALTVLLFVFAFYRMPGLTVVSSAAHRARDALVALSAGAVMTVLLLLATHQQRIEPISEFYSANSYFAAHGRNVVNVILVDFRALDTLGEIVVVATAAIGVYALLKLVMGKESSI